MAAVESDPNTTPVAPPPPGHTTNLVDPPSEWTRLLCIVIVALVVTLSFVSARMFTKLRLLRKLSYEDYVLVLAQVVLIVWCILLIVQPTHGADVWNTSLADYPKFLYWSNLLIILYVPSVLIAKWAILLQLQRVFTVQTRDSTWWTVRILIWISSTFYVTVGFIDIFQCTPRRKIWDPTVPGHCFNINVVLIGTSVFNVVMNLSILILPLVVLHGVQMQRRKKIVVTVMFGVTSLAALSSALRIVWSVFFSRSDNPTRAIFPVAYWAIGEIACIILATTFPTMPRFFEYVRSGFDSRAGSTHTVPPSPLSLPPVSEQAAEAYAKRRERELQGRARRSWYQLTAIAGELDGEVDEEKEAGGGNESRLAINAADDEASAASSMRANSTRPPSTRDGASILGMGNGGVGGATKTGEVDVTSMV